MSLNSPTPDPETAAAAACSAALNAMVDPAAPGRDAHAAARRVLITLIGAVQQLGPSQAAALQAAIAADGTSRALELAAASAGAPHAPVPADPLAPGLAGWALGLAAAGLTPDPQPLDTWFHQELPQLRVHLAFADGLETAERQRGRRGLRDFMRHGLT